MIQSLQVEEKRKGRVCVVLCCVSILKEVKGMYL